MTAQNTALEVYKHIDNPFEAAMKIGPHFARSGLFGCDTEQAGTILALACLTEGKTPFDIVRQYDIVKGKLRKKSLAIAAEFRQRGGKIKWINTGEDGKEASAEFTFEEQTITQRFTIADAQRAKLVKADSNWEKTPANMLRARVLSNGISILCPEIVAGVADPAEDEGDATTEPGKPLLQKKTTVTVDPAPQSQPQQAAPEQPQEKTIDAEIVQEHQMNDATDLVSQAAVDPATNRLTVPTVQTLIHLIGEDNIDKAIGFLKARNRFNITEGREPTLSDLQLKIAQMIIDKPDAFRTSAQIK